MKSEISESFLPKFYEHGKGSFMRMIYGNISKIYIHVASLKASYCVNSQNMNKDDENVFLISHFVANYSVHYLSNYFIMFALFTREKFRQVLRGNAGLIIQMTFSPHGENTNVC